MVTPKTGCVKKVLLGAAVALLCGAGAAGAADLNLPMAQVDQALTLKVDEQVQRKLEQRKDRSGADAVPPRFPVRIADHKRGRVGLPVPRIGGRMTVM